MLDPSRSTVVCAVEDAAAADVLHEAVRGTGARAVRCRRSQYLAASRRVEGPQALVYDLQPWNEEAVRFLSDIRESRPHVPVLVYAPPRPPVGELMMQAIDLRVTNVLLHGTGEREIDRVRRAVVELVEAIPANVLLPIIHDVMGSVPERVSSYVEESVLRAMSPTETTRLRPKEIAATRGVGLRTLERDLNKAGLPVPQEMLDWVRLLVICFVSYWYGMAAGRVARGIGVSSNQLYRLRHRRLVEAHGSGEEPTSEFKKVLTEFAGRCQSPSVDADQILQHLVA